MDDTKLNESDFPGVEDIFQAIRHLPSQVEPEYQSGDGDGDPGTMDVRLQVWEDGSWKIRTGSSQYDQDGRGFWGCGTVGMDDTEENMRTLAADLREQALEDCAMAGQLTEDEEFQRMLQEEDSERWGGSTAGPLSDRERFGTE